MSVIDPKWKKNAMSVRFWLKPYLHSFAVGQLGSDEFVIGAPHIIGGIGKACITTKPKKVADRAGETFCVDRKFITGYMTVRHRKDHGSHVMTPAQFEVLIEHLFYHLLLSYVDQRIAMGGEQNASIREFLEVYEVDTHGLDPMSLKKTIIRRRQRSTVAIAGKFGRMLSPTAKPTMNHVRG